MPIYVYICDTCKKEYQTYERIFDDPHTKCELCNKGKVVRKIFAPQVMTNEPRTLGSLAEKNSAAISDDQQAALDEEYRTKRDEKLSRLIPGSTPVNTKYDKKEAERLKKLRKMTPEQQRKYVMTGKGL